MHTSGATASGTVIEVAEHERTRRTGRRSRRLEEYTAVCPRIEFRVPGREIPVEFVEYDDCDRLAVGDTVPVMYDPEEPSAARLDTEAVLEVEERAVRLRWWLRGLGVLFLAGSTVGLVRRLRRRTTQA